jgi:RimJ/RimL family protein N-acetyltransferase
VEEPGAQVRLRAVEEPDVATFFANQQDPEGTAMAAMPSRSADDHVAHWRRILADDTVIARTVELHGAVAGNVVSWVDGDDRLVGYWIGRRFWGTGVATKALALFVKEIDQRPLRAYVARQNVGSIRVLEKCGFTLARTRHEPGDVEELVYVLDA